MTEIGQVSSFRLYVYPPTTDLPDGALRLTVNETADDGVSQSPVVSVDLTPQDAESLSAYLRQGVSDLARRR